PVIATLEAGDSVPAVCAFLEGLSPIPRAVRLFYQGPSLESVPTACPQKAGRRMLRQVLGSKFPALSVPTTAWAAHPPQTHGPGATTLLYLAQNAFLVQLQAALASRQIRLEAVYPLFVLVETEPVFRPEGTPAMAVLHGSHGMGIFWLSPSGDRHAAFFTGPTAGERLQQSIATGLSIFEGRGRPPLLVINASSSPLDQGLLPQPALQQISIGDFLASAGHRPLPDLANLLPAPPRLWPALIAHTVALLLFLLTLLLGQHYLSACHQARVNLAYQQAQLQALTAEVAHLETNQAGIEKSEAFLAELSGGSRSKARFLGALGRLRPPQLTLSAVTLNESSWTLRGVLHEGTNDEHGPYAAFHRAFFKEGEWLPGPDSRNPRLATAEFTLSGTFP
ncbi:MAG: hypothetical protein ACHQ5A_13140, partial [Opitutales bacterium]